MTLIIANWKMNPPTLKEAKKLFDATKKASASKREVNMVVAPPFVFLQLLASSYSGHSIAFATQNVHWENDGPYTGEISAQQAKDVGAGYSLVGHAERRLMGETNEDVRKKITAVLAIGMTPVLCVGEHERDSDGEYLTVLRDQITEGLADVAKSRVKDVIIAYEPIWAIGAQEAMRPQQMHEMSIFIRKILHDQYEGEAGKITILYGGSTNEENCKSMMLGGDVDGLLVGRASTKPDALVALIEHI